MKKFLVFLCLLATASVAFAQTQRGYVKTRGRLAANGTLNPGKHLSGATLVLKGNKTVVSGSNGMFTFSDPSKKYCVTKVQKNGYQLYDRDLLGKTHSYSTNDLWVVMDTPDNVLADKLASERKIRRTLQKLLNDKEDEIEDLKKQQKITEEEYQKKLQALYQSQENNEKIISEMAERYSTLDFDQLDDFQRRVAAFIQNGELTRADSLLNTKGSMEERSAELDRESAAIKENAEELKKRQEDQAKSEALYAKKLEDFAADCYSRFEICKLRHDNDSAAYWLELRAGKDTTNVDWLLELSIFVRKYLSNYQQALHYAQRALNVATMKQGAEGLDVAACQNNIGFIYTSLAKYEDALECFKRSQNICLSSLGSFHPNVATLYNNIGGIYDSQGRYSEALECYQKSFDILKSSLGENHPEVAKSYNNIGSVYFTMGKYAQAFEQFQKAFEIIVTSYGSNHPDVALYYNNIGQVFSEVGVYDKVIEYSENALKIWEENYNHCHPAIASCLNNLGSAYNEQKNYTKALELFTQSLNIRLKLYGEFHPEIATSYNNIASVYMSQKEYVKALDYHMKSLKIRLEYYGENHPDVAASYNNIGYVYGKQGSYDLAIGYFQKVQKINHDLFGEKHPDVARSYNNIGGIYLTQGKFPEALEYFKKALLLRTEIYGESHPSVQTVHNNIAGTYWKAKTEGFELSDFEEYVKPRVFICRVSGNDSPAVNAGMSGEYYVLEFADWTMDSDVSLFAKNEELQGKPKTIVVMKDDEISLFHFENNMGTQLGFKKVGEEEKQRIIKAYHEWKAKQ